MIEATDAPGASARMPATTAGNAECRSATTTGMPPIESASSSAPWCGESCSSTPSTMTWPGV
jgi:hypothetical protein